MDTHDEKDSLNSSVLVTTDWVADHLGDKSVRVVESRDDTNPNGFGHIPGAVQVEWSTILRGHTPELQHTRTEFDKLMSCLGVKNDTILVIYGDKNNWWEYYAFWVSHLHNRRNVKIMDGDRLKWMQEKRPTTDIVLQLGATAHPEPHAEHPSNQKNQFNSYSLKGVNHGCVK